MATHQQSAMKNVLFLHKFFMIHSAISLGVNSILHDPVRFNAILGQICTHLVLLNPREVTVMVSFRAPQTFFQF